MINKSSRKQIKNSFVDRFQDSRASSKLITSVSTTLRNNYCIFNPDKRQCFTMPNIYRICLPKLPYIEPVQLVNPHFVTKKVFFIQEKDAHTWSPIRDILISGSFNYSIIAGNRQRGGICQNTLHDNSSDIVFMPADLPVNDDMIDIYGVIGQSQLEFQSSYHYIDKTRNADVIESVLSFKFFLWMLILFLILLFAGLMKSKKSRTCPEYLRGFMERLHRVFAHFIGQNSIDDNRIKLLIITLTFFSLMMNQYYNALIHTDLVVPEVPKVAYSYQDFASTVTVLGFATGTSVLKYFKESPEDYPERRLYNELIRRNVTIGNGLPVERPHWTRGILGRAFYDSMFRLNKHHVSIGSQIHLTGLLTTICWAKVYSEAPELQEYNPSMKTHFVPRFRTLYPWISSDPQTRSILHAFIKRKDFIPDKKIWERVKRSIEHGMYQRIIWTAEAFDITEDFFIEIKERPTQMRDCKEYSRKLKIKEVGFEDLKVVNFQKFAYVFLVLISACFMALIVEVYLKRQPTQVHPM